MAVLFPLLSVYSAVYLGLMIADFFLKRALVPRIWFRWSTRRAVRLSMMSCVGTDYLPVRLVRRSPDSQGDRDEGGLSMISCAGMDYFSGFGLSTVPVLAAACNTCWGEMNWISISPMRRA